jgi:tartrate-resistant acid phosphatase type 5
LRADDERLFGRAPDVVATDDEVVFAVVGDAGVGNAVQAVTARSIHDVCAGHCDFVLLLGDNLYPEGTVVAADEARMDCLMSRYPTTRKYLVLGNHDYAPVAPRLERGRRQLEWVERQPTVFGRHHFYRFDAGPVRLFGLDTNYLVRGRPGLVDRALVSWTRAIREQTAGWTVVFGHHPYLSNGEHGNAGSYRDGGLLLWPGTWVQRLMEDQVIGHADLYLAGHDHNLQFLTRSLGGTGLVVSGSGSKCNGRGFDAANTPVMEYYGHGFTLVSAARERLTVAFYDAFGKTLFEVSRTRASAWEASSDAVSHRLRDHCDEQRLRAERLAREGELLLCDKP